MNKFLLVFFAVCFSILSVAQTVSTFSGNGGYANIDGTPIDGSFKSPREMVMDQSGFIYMTDLDAHTIRRVDLLGNIITIAGDDGVAGDKDGQGAGHNGAGSSITNFNSPLGIVIDINGNLYIADSGNNKIRKIDVSGNVTTFAGSGVSGNTNGQGSAASFNKPQSLAIDAIGNIYVTDSYNHLIRKIDPMANVTTFAGTGINGNTNGLLLSASFSYPHAIEINSQGEIFIGSGYAIRKISTLGVVSTFAGNPILMGDVDAVGTNARFTDIADFAFDKVDNLFVTTFHNYKIKKVTPSGDVSTFSGSSYGNNNGSLLSATFGFPAGIVFDGYTNFYVSDVDFRTIRKINIPLTASCPLIVTNINDAGVGSLRECIRCANAMPGKDIITFSLSSTDTILIRNSLPFIVDSLTILGNADASGWPSSNIKSGLSNYINYSQYNYSNSAFVLGSDNITFKYISIKDFYYGLSIVKSNNVIIEQNSFVNIKQKAISPSPYFFYNGHGGTVIKNNTFNIDKNDNIIGNTAGQAIELYLNSTTNIQNLILNNVIGNCSPGILADGHTIISGNYIGISKSNKKINLQVSSGGIRLGGDNNVVSKNVIGNSFYGIELYVTGLSNNVIDSNIIGEDAFGNSHPVEYGAFLYGRYNNVFSNNKISNFRVAGIERNQDTTSSYTRIFISKNKIINANPTLEAILNEKSSTYINYRPIITSFTASGNTVTLTGKSRPNDTTEVFYSKNAYIESADEYVGTVYSDATGKWTLTFTKKPAYQYVRALFTKNSQTSFFSQAFPIDEAVLTCLVTNTNDTGSGSLRDAIVCANQTPGPNIIKFAIQGAGPYIIKPLTSLPDCGVITDDIVVLGKTQAQSGLGTGNQEIIIDGSTIPLNTGLIMYRAEVRDITFKNGGVNLFNSTLIQSSFDSTTVKIGSPSNPFLTGIVDSCTFYNNSSITFNTDSDPAIIAKVTNSYFYNSKTAFEGAFIGDSIIIENNIIGQDKFGNILPVKGGISIAVSHYSRIKNNIIYTDATYGPAIKFQSMQRVEILNNTITKVGSLLSTNSLIQVNSTDTLIINGNTITNSYLNGIDIWYIKNSWIENNVVSGCRGDGIGSNSGNNDSMYVRSNITYSNGKNGIYINSTKKVSVTNNTVGVNGTIAAPNGLAGIFIYATNIDSVSNNRLENNKQGLALSAVHALTGKSAVIYQNTISKNDTAVFITNSSNGLGFKNNTMSNSSAYGFYMMNGSSSSVFINNTISSSGVAGLYGIGGISNNTFTSNTFTQNKTGIELRDGSSNNTFEKNSFSSAVKNIKIFNGSNNNKLSQNTFLNADTAIYLNRNITPGNNNKDTSTISSYIQTASYIDLVGKGLNTDTIEVFNGNGNKEQTTAYINHAKVVGTDYTLRIPVNVGYNPLANNYYLVTATDLAGNTSQLSNFIKVPVKLFSNKLNVLPNQVGICLGDSAQVDAVAEDVNYYKWYNQATGVIVSSIKKPYLKKGGNYILEVGDAFGNTASDTIRIIENALPLASDFLMASEAGILDNIVAIDISYTKPDSLVWNWGSATAVWNNDKYLLTFPQTGVYTIGLTSYLGLCAKKTSHDITIVPGKLSPNIDTIYSSTIIRVLAGPNPVITDITFNAELTYNEIVTTQIFNLLGSLIYTYQTPFPARSHTFAIDMSSVSSGTYIVKVLSGTDQRVIKVIKN